jgi:succinate-semialdehyde dehydrogenase/glutarate-semialdehyde dehydrogenase
MAYTSINPANGKLIQSFPEHTNSEVDAALWRAHEAFLSWRFETFATRAAVVRKAADLMRERLEELSRMATMEMGKLIEESRAETLLSADILSYYADHAERFLAPVQANSGKKRGRVVSQPIGVLFGIEPWNFPYYQLARFVAPNLMAGNTILLKHAPAVPQCAQLFARLFQDAGAKEGVYTDLRLTNEQAARVIADERVRGVAVTGSERAGSSIGSEAGKVLKRSTMELGGSDPFIVLEDANLEKAIKWGAWSRLLNCGQGCVCAKRFIVVDSLYDRFLDGILKAVAARKVGDPMNKETTLGPLSSEGAREFLLDQIARSVKAGATLVTGGNKQDREGFYVEPAILANIHPENPAYIEEFFGPVFLMFRVRDDEEAIKLANDSPFGLAAVIFSADEVRAEALATQIDAGMVFINRPAWTAPDLPFGGIKHSGYGRELSELGIQEFVNKKLIDANSPDTIGL